MCLSEVRVIFDTYARFPKIFIIASMTQLDVRNNWFWGEEGKAALRKAIEGRSGFKLLM